MNNSLDRRTALKLATAAGLAIPLGADAMAQPRPSQPPGPTPGSKPATPPGRPGGTTPALGGAAPSRDAPVPNAPATPSEIGGRKFEEWLRDIESPDPGVRAEAIRVVCQFGPIARRAVPALVKQVRQLNDISPQAMAIIALSEIIPMVPPPAPGGTPDGYTVEAVNALIQALDSPQAIIRYRAAKALGDIGAPARAAVRHLINRIDDRQSWEIRKEVCYALGACGRDEQMWPIPNALEALAKGVSDRESRAVRLEALQSIIVLGPTNPPMPLQLRHVLERRLKEERDKAVLTWVRVAIMRLDESAVNDANLSALSKQMMARGADLDSRVQAAKALGFIGAAAKSKVPDLIEALTKSEEPTLQYQLCWSLARMGREAEKALGPLRTLQSDAKDEAVRTAAKDAVAEIEKAMKQPAPPPQQPPKK